MKSVYDERVTIDQYGEAEVELPQYFERLNKDFRYQLTVIGTFAQAIVLTKSYDVRDTTVTVLIRSAVVGVDSVVRDHHPALVERDPTRDVVRGRLARHQSDVSGCTVVAAEPRYDTERAMSWHDQSCTSR